MNKKTYTVNGIKFTHGDYFKGKLFNEVSGRVSIESGKLYFCTNDSDSDYANCKEQFGYPYAFDYDGEIIEVMRCRKSEVEQPYPKLHSWVCRPIGKNIHFGCGRVTLSKSDICKFIKIIKDPFFKKINTMLEEMAIDISDLDINEINQLEKLCKK